MVANCTGDRSVPLLWASDTRRSRGGARTPWRSSCRARSEAVTEQVRAGFLGDCGFGRAEWAAVRKTRSGTLRSIRVLPVPGPDFFRRPAKFLKISHLRSTKSFSLFAVWVKDPRRPLTNDSNPLDRPELWPPRAIHRFGHDARKPGTLATRPPGSRPRSRPPESRAHPALEIPRLPWRGIHDGRDERFLGPGPTR
jgi:hypothetical protein